MLRVKSRIPASVAPHKSCDIYMNIIFNPGPSPELFPCSEFSSVSRGVLRFLIIRSKFLWVNLDATLTSSCYSSKNYFPCEAKPISFSLLPSPMMASSAIQDSTATPKNLPKLTLHLSINSNYHGSRMDSHPLGGWFFLLPPHLGNIWAMITAFECFSNHPE